MSIKNFNARKGLYYILLGVILWLLVGCYYERYEPSICKRETVDTIAVFTVEGLADTGYAVYTECAKWCAFSDTTKCWDKNGERIP